MTVHGKTSRNYRVLKEKFKNILWKFVSIPSLDVAGNYQYINSLHWIRYQSADSTKDVHTQHEVFFDSSRIYIRNI